MAAVFNGPMPPVDGEETLGIGLFWGSTREAINKLHGVFATLFHDAVAFDGEGLCDMREVEIGVEFRSGPDFSDFDASVLWRGMFDEVGLSTILEEEGEIFEESFLISFDDEVIMGVTVGDDVVGEFALSQEGIGGQIFVLEVEGVEQRDSGFDFVGSFEFLVVLGGEGSHFFWV